MLNNTIRTQHFLLIFILIALTYSQSLSFPFKGDDAFIFSPANNFYQKPSNITKLFSREYIASYPGVTLDGNMMQFSHSGCIAYRPVTALSFFVSEFLGKGKPYAFYLGNIILHFFNAAAAYLLIFYLFGNIRWALLSAVLFSVHPIQADLINISSYRSDILATFFYLLSFLVFVLVDKQNLKKAWLNLSIIFLCFGVFAKEIAVTYPAIIMSYWILFIPKKEKREWLLRYKGYLLAVGGVVLIYLYVYCFVFPNATWADRVLNANINKINSVIITLLLQIRSLFLPWDIGIWPPYYMPTTGLINFSWITVLSVFIAVSAWIIQNENRKYISFAVLWFFIAYLPVSNLFFNPTPIAHRYLYLPSIGFFIIAAMVWERAIEFIISKYRFINWRFILRFLLIGLLSALTIKLTSYYKDDLVMNEKIVKDYPLSTQPYTVLCSIYNAMGKEGKAVACYEQLIANMKHQNFYRAQRPEQEIYLEIGRSHITNPQKALEAFDRSIELEPSLASAYAHRAKALYLLNRQGEAKESLDKALLLEPNSYEANYYMTEMFNK